MSANVPLPEPTFVMPRLEGERVHLRALDEGDLGALFALYSDPKVVRYGIARAWHLESQAREYLERSQRGFAERGRIVRAGRGRRVGFGKCGLRGFGRLVVHGAFNTSRTSDRLQVKGT